MQWQARFQEYLDEVRTSGGTPMAPIACVQLHLTMKLLKASPSLSASALSAASLEQVCRLLLSLRELAPTPELVPETWSWDPVRRAVGGCTHQVDI